MHIFDNRRMRFAWLLMLVYLPMMTAITFHTTRRRRELQLCPIVTIASIISTTMVTLPPVRVSLTIAFSASCTVCHTWFLLSST